MEYEALLNEAMEHVDAGQAPRDVKSCGRFEILDVSGHHEGTRTVITNFCKVAACLRRSPEHLLKFLCKELAGCGEISGDRLIFSRKISSKEVNEKIRRYVSCFVLCSECGKPDTELENSGGIFSVHCLACGNRRQVPKV